MPKVPRVVTITVTDAVDGSGEKTRKVTARRMPRSEDIEVTRVHPEVLAKALELAGGDTSRIEFHSGDATQLTVHNNPGWRKK
jgi:hypothetical protein